MNGHPHPLMSATLLALSLLPLSQLPGCVAPVSGDRGFAAVRDTVRARTGQEIQWNRRGGEAEARAAADAANAIRGWLENELTVDTAVRIALLNNQNLQATYEDIGIAQAELAEAGAVRNPTFAAEFRLPSYRALPFDFNIAQSFLDLVLLPLKQRAAGAAFEAARLRMTHDVLNTVAGVKTSFYRAQGAAQLLEMRRRIVAATDASLETARRLREAGNITELALANERALHEQSKIELARAERDLLDAREDLVGLLGLWGEGVQIKVAARLPEPPAGEVDPEHLESLAVSQRADLAAARQLVDAANVAVSLQRAALFGSDVTIGGHLSRETDGATSAGPNLSVALPIFNQGQPAIAAGQARFRQAERRFAALAVQVRGEVRRARNNLVAARESAEYYKRVIVPLRHLIVEQDLLQVNAMQATVFELLQAREAEIDAGREYVEAIKSYWIARTELERAVGGALPPNRTPAGTTPGNAGAGGKE